MLSPTLEAIGLYQGSLPLFILIFARVPSVDPKGPESSCSLPILLFRSCFYIDPRSTISRFPTAFTTFGAIFPFAPSFFGLLTDGPLQTLFHILQFCHRF